MASSLQMQATFTLESVVDGKQRFSLENLYILLPENIEGKQMEFSFKQATETVSTPVKPIQTTIPFAPVKAPSSSFFSVDKKMPKLIDSEPYLNANRKLNLNPNPANQSEITVQQLELFHQCAMNRGVSITPNDKYGWGINYNNFLKHRKYCTPSLDKPLKDQINDYLYSEYASPSILAPAVEREDWHRLCLLRSLFEKNSFQWQHEYFAVYKDWSAKYGNPQGSNRYKKMMKFLDEHRSLFTSF